MKPASPRAANGATPAARTRGHGADAHADLPPLSEVAIDEDNARRACAPMGTLQSIVVSRSARRTRTYYVIEPDPALGDEYERQGLTLEPGCRVLVDAAALRPLAVLAVTEAAPAPRAEGDAPAGFNPYFDLPGA